MWSGKVELLGSSATLFMLHQATLGSAYSPGGALPFLGKGLYKENNGYHHPTAITIKAEGICLLKCIIEIKFIYLKFIIWTILNTQFAGSLAYSQCCEYNHSVQFSSVQLLSRVRLFATPWIAARQASLSITNSRSLLKLMSIESVMPSNHFFLCHPLLLPPSIFSSIRVFSNESAHRIRLL